MKLIINQNVEYANHTNSSAPTLSQSSASGLSLSNLIRNTTITIDDGIKEKPIIKNEITEIPKRSD